MKKVISKNSIIFMTALMLAGSVNVANIRTQAGELPYESTITEDNSEAEVIKGYQVTETARGLRCTYDGVEQKKVYLTVKKSGDIYTVTPRSLAGSRVYYFDLNGYGKVVQKDGIVAITYKNRKENYYIKNGRVAIASKPYHTVYNNYLYFVRSNGKATKSLPESKKMNYKKVVDGNCYTVNYKTARVTGYTGMYKKKCYKSGKPTNGWQTVNQKKYYCKNGEPVKGIVKVNKNVYYFQSDGSLYRKQGWATIGNKYYYFTGSYTAKTGWLMYNKECYYFNDIGQMQTNKKIDGVSIDARGIATAPLEKVVPLKAKLIVESITNDSMSKEQKLRVCFDYVINTYKSNGNPRIPHYHGGTDWVYIYANDMFGTRGGGNCFSYAAAFAFLAKQCGYTEVYACNSSGHGWVEVDGLAYDPEQYKDVGKKIYAMSYSNPMIGNYKNAISGYKTSPWMYVKITD